jgi:hypothetical protein
VLTLCASRSVWAQSALGSVTPDAVLKGASDASTTGDASLATSNASSQTPSPADSGWDVSIYPALLWMPSASVSTNIPPRPDVPGGPDLPGESASTSSSFDGAYLGGFSMETSRFRVDVDGIWVALTTLRDRPLLGVDLDVIYGHVSGGVKVYGDLFVTAGLRRFALKYEIAQETRPSFTRKPGIWDPLVGVAWHGALGPKWTLHLVGEGGGFGVGSDVDLLGSARADWKFADHFGATFGYSVLYFKFSDKIGDRTLEIKPTLYGPLVGVGFYF